MVIFDLKDRLKLAGKALLAMLDKDNSYLPTRGYEVAHDLGRWWDTVLRLEGAVGFEIPKEIENSCFKNLQFLTDNPEKLLMMRNDLAGFDGVARINPHNLHESLITYAALVRYRNNDWARNAGMQLVKTIDKIFHKNGSLDFSKTASWSKYPFTEDPSHTEAEVPRNGRFDATATSGRCLEALIWFCEVTAEQMVLDVAKRIADHHIKASVNEDGSVKKEIVDVENVGHNHSYLGTLRGLLLYGLLCKDNKFIDTIEATYRNAVRFKIVRESGWAPHDLGKTRFANEYGDPVVDPASAGDSAQLALWLALETGHGYLFDDVERLVRARLIPAQCTEEDIKSNPDDSFEEREVGSWTIQSHAHSDKGCTPDASAAVTHTLCDVYNNICTPLADGVRVNFHFDFENDEFVIQSKREQTAEVKVLMKKAQNLFIRIPQWAPEKSVKLKIDGKANNIDKKGCFAYIDAKKIDNRSVIILSYDLPERMTKEKMPSGREYKFKWRGDEIVGITPQEKHRPFYDELL